MLLTPLIALVPCQAPSRSARLQPPGKTLAERRTWMERALTRLHAFDDDAGRRKDARLLFLTGDARRALVVAGDRVASFTYRPPAPIRMWSSRLVARGAKDGLTPEGTLGRYLDLQGRWLWNKLWPVPQGGIEVAGPWAYDRENPTSYAIYNFAGGKISLEEINPNGATVPKPTTPGTSGGLPVLASETQDPSLPSRFP